MVLVLILHIVRVYLTGGFKKPRELIWMTGIRLAISTVSFGVTGYSLPWDQVGYWACKIVTSVPEAFDNLIPGMGKLSVFDYGVPASVCCRSAEHIGSYFRILNLVYWSF